MYDKIHYKLKKKKIPVKKKKKKFFKYNMNSVNLHTPAPPHELFILFNEMCICLVMQAIYCGVTLTRLFSIMIACWNHLRTRLKDTVLEQ